MRGITRALVPAVLFAAAAGLALAAGRGSVGWRTDGTGKYPRATPPVEWSPDKNVVWRTPMPDWSNSTPVIVGDRLFVCSEPTTLVCVRLTDGEILWTRKLDYKDVLTKAQLAGAEANKAKVATLVAEREEVAAEIRKIRAQLRGKKDPELRRKYNRLRRRADQIEVELQVADAMKLPRKHADNGYSSPTPVSDGKRVFVLFGTGVVACFDLEGNRKWARLHEKPRAGYGHSSSPVLVGDKLIVHVLDLVALDTRTGKELWRVKSPVVWGTPAAAKIGDTDVVITSGGDIVGISDGKVIARKIGKLTYASPIVHEGIVYFIEKRATAVKLPKAAAGNLRLLPTWTSRIKGSRHYASSVVHDGLIYASSQEEDLSVLDARTGEVVYQRKLHLGMRSNSVYPSVTMAGGHIYVASQNGTTVVIKPGRKYDEIARNSLEKHRSSPVFLGGRMYLRGMKHLYCIGEKD